MSRARLALSLAAVLAACGAPIDNAGGVGPDAGAGGDPLDVPAGADDGSLDHIHRSVLLQRCAGQPGLCHNGQFEPNLATPASAYNYLVNRPAIEDGAVLRVAPGAPGDSFLIDKLRDRNSVATQMPLGADPLAEEEIALVEAWIENGALRRPGVEPAPELNNPPMAPEIAVFDAGGNRLDLAGPFTIAPNTTLTLRHSVRDFETADADVPFGVFVLQTADGREVILRPAAAEDPQLGVTTYDPGAPEGSGDLLNYEFELTIGTNLELRDQATGQATSVPSSGLSFNVICAYLDDLGATDAMAAFSIEPALITVE